MINQLSTVTTTSPEMLGEVVFTGGAPSSGSLGANNDAALVPMVMQMPVLVKRLFAFNGTAVSGNIDMGIYSVKGERITSIGSTVQAGTSAFQYFDIADYLLNPGQYYLAVALSSLSGKVFTWGVSGRYAPHYGVLSASSAFALPATVTFASGGNYIIPLIGMEVLGTL